MRVYGSLREHALYAAVQEVYEKCGPEPPEGKDRIRFRPAALLPVWKEGVGWRFEDVSCPDLPEGKVGAFEASAPPGAVATRSIRD